MASKNKMKYMNEWQKKKCRRFVLALNQDSQGDVIEYLEKHSPVTTFVVELIREHINGQK
jgi:hypothetical protein